jgi:hypothetical protein
MTSPSLSRNRLGIKIDAAKKPPSLRRSNDPARHRGRLMLSQALRRLLAADGPVVARSPDQHGPRQRAGGARSVPSASLSGNVRTPRCRLRPGFLGGEPVRGAAVVETPAVAPPLSDDAVASSARVVIVVEADAQRGSRVVWMLLDCRHLAPGGQQNDTRRSSKSFRPISVSATARPKPCES